MNTLERKSGIEWCTHTIETQLGKRVFYHNDARLFDEIREWAKT